MVHITYKNKNIIFSHNNIFYLIFLIYIYCFLDSARLAFSEIDGPYTGDKIIENAVKDWLKLANNRLSYSITKKTN